MIAVFAYTLDLAAVWAYANPLGHGAGMGEHAIGRVLAASIAFQAAGSLVVARFGRLIDARHGLFLVLLLQGVGLRLLAIDSGPSAFIAGLCLWGFGWNFGIALILGLLARHTHGDQLLAMVPGAEAIGAAAGPALIAVFVGIPLSLTVPFVGFAALATAITVAFALPSDSSDTRDDE